VNWVLAQLLRRSPLDNKILLIQFLPSERFCALVNTRLKEIIAIYIFCACQACSNDFNSILLREILF